MYGDGEEVKLVMPATPQLLRVARLTAAGLASRLGFSFDEVEDVKIAVDELCFAVVGSKGREGTLSLVYQLQADSLMIEGTGDFPGQDVRVTTGELSDLILSAVVDEHELSDGDGTVHFKLTKRRNPRP